MNDVDVIFIIKTVLHLLGIGQILNFLFLMCPSLKSYTLGSNLGTINIHNVDLSKIRKNNNFQKVFYVPN